MIHNIWIFQIENKVEGEKQSKHCIHRGTQNNKHIFKKDSGEFQI